MSVKGEAKHTLRRTAKLSDLESECLQIVLDHAGEFGLSAVSVHGRLTTRAGRTTIYTGRALTALAQRGLIDRHLASGHSNFRYTAPGIELQNRGNSPREEFGPIKETPEQAKALEKLFAAARCDYSHGEIVKLERGRVGLKPSMPIPGRAIGGW